MPLYEYRCGECNKEFEALILSAEDKTFCPECNSESLEKLYSTFGFKSESVESSPSAQLGSSCGCRPSGCGCASS